MTIWQNFVATALLGTERQAPTLPPPGDPLGELLAQLDTNDKEHALLSAAAVIAFHQRAGRLPVTDTQPLIAPCELDDQPYCSSRSTQHLAMMLDGAHRNVLPEWLVALAMVGRRVPEEYLYGLLDTGKRDTDLRPLILPVIGRRGSWLAAQNADWRYAINVDSETDWQTGSRAARVLLLQRLRASDPNAARDLLVSTWSEESADDCAAFLETFVTGLNMDDEPFLESLLDDRRKRVRAIAADLLARLPESRLSQRMIERVKRLVTFQPKRKPRIDVTLPDTCDDMMIRDGVDLKPQRHMGEKTWWLFQMVSVIAPSFWCEEWRMSPADAIRTIRRREWKKVMLEAISVAARRYSDEAWIEAFITATFTPDDEFVVDPTWLIGVMPLDRLDTLVRRIIDTIKDRHGVLSACKHQWSEALSRKVIQYLHSDLAKTTDRISLEQYALYITPTLLEEARIALTQAAETVYWKPNVERFLATLYFRHEMLKELHA